LLGRAVGGIASECGEGAEKGVKSGADLGGTLRGDGAGDAEDILDLAERVGLGAGAGLGLHLLLDALFEDAISRGGGRGCGRAGVLRPIERDRVAGLKTYDLIGVADGVLIGDVIRCGVQRRLVRDERTTRHIEQGA